MQGAMALNDYIVRIVVKATNVETAKQVAQVMINQSGLTGRVLDSKDMSDRR